MKKKIARKVTKTLEFNTRFTSFSSFLSTSLSPITRAALSARIFRRRLNTMACFTNSNDAHGITYTQLRIIWVSYLYSVPRAIVNNRMRLSCFGRLLHEECQKTRFLDGSRLPAGLNNHKPVAVCPTEG